MLNPPTPTNGSTTAPAATVSNPYAAAAGVPNAAPTPNGNPLNTSTKEQTKAKAQQALRNANSSNVMTPPPVNPYNNQEFKSAVVKQAYAGAILSGAARMLPAFTRMASGVGRGAQKVLTGPAARTTGAMELGSQAGKHLNTMSPWQYAKARFPRTTGALPYLAAGGVGYGLGSMGGSGAAPQQPYYGNPYAQYNVPMHYPTNPYSAAASGQHPFAQQYHPYMRQMDPLAVGRTGIGYA